MVFQWEIYQHLNPDLPAAGLTTQEQLVRHWINHGISEKRKSCVLDEYPDFDWKVYTRNYSDLQNMTKSQAEVHWIKHGRHEHRSYKSSSIILPPTQNESLLRVILTDENDTIRVSIIPKEDEELPYIPETPTETKAIPINPQQVYKEPVGPILTCIVTAYYIIPSKFSDEKYRMWIYNFMNTVKVPVFLFTSHELAGYFRGFKKPNVHIIVRPFSSMYFYQYIDVFRHQWFCDNIKQKRSPELYCLWHNKFHFIREVAEYTKYKYDNYIWCDIGAFREKQLLPMRQRFGMLRRRLNTLHLLALRKPEPKDTTRHDDDIWGKVSASEAFIGGGVLAVPVNKIYHYIDIQSEIFTKLCKTQRFFGCDQRTLAYMYGEYPNEFKLVFPPAHYNKETNPSNADRWFYLLDYFCS